MKNDILEILRQFYRGDISIEEAAQQVEDLIK